MNQAGLSELLTPSGFFQYLAQQTKLDPEAVKRIYLCGIPWNLWPRDLDITGEAAAAGVTLFTYLAAMQPLIDMDTREKEAELAAYEVTLTHCEAMLAPAIRAQVEKVAAISGTDKETICRVLHALYTYRQRVGRLSIQKVGEESKHRMEQQAISNAEISRVMIAQETLVAKLEPGKPVL